MKTSSVFRCDRDTVRRLLVDSVPGTDHYEFRIHFGFAEGGISLTRCGTSNHALFTYDPFDLDGLEEYTAQLAAYTYRQLTREHGVAHAFEMLRPEVLTYGPKGYMHPNHLNDLILRYMGLTRASFGLSVVA